ncbi:hypothetical protein M405DRAFT_283801 [Rhizopogon salebrosus TDB-379]|nr:hypothetical protein M405DRAFT_283801 [Rhizopogon salebrosus TDB-379]
MRRVRMTRKRQVRSLFTAAAHVHGIGQTLVTAGQLSADRMFISFAHPKSFYRKCWSEWLSLQPRSNQVEVLRVHETPNLNSLKLI